MLVLKLLISILYYSLLYVQSYPENWDLFSSLVAVSDENGRKQTEKLYFYFRFYIFLAETGSGSENTGTETGSGYAEVRKRTNTDVEPERIT